MFIVIEGIDGSGKGTQFSLLKERLESEWKSVYTLDFPRYEEPSSYFVQQYLNGKYGDHLWPKQSSLFYALDRFDALHGKSEELASYDYILSNRYVSSSMIHQWGKIADSDERSKFLDWLDEIEFGILGLPRPDRVLFLDVPPSISEWLISKKNDRSYIQWDTNKDIHEKDSSHLQNAYNCCLDLVDKYESWQRIGCLDDRGEILSIEQIGEIIYDAISC